MEFPVIAACGEKEGATLRGASGVAGREGESPPARAPSCCSFRGSPVGAISTPQSAPSSPLFFRVRRDRAIFLGLRAYGTPSLPHRLSLVGWARRLTPGRGADATPKEGRHGDRATERTSPAEAWARCSAFEGLRAEDRRVAGRGRERRKMSDGDDVAGGCVRSRSLRVDTSPRRSACGRGAWTGARVSARTLPADGNGLFSWSALRAVAWSGVLRAERTPRRRPFLLLVERLRRPTTGTVIAGATDGGRPDGLLEVHLQRPVQREVVRSARGDLSVSFDDARRFRRRSAPPRPVSNTTAVCTWFPGQART